MKKFMLLENYSESYEIATSEHDSKEDAQNEFLRRLLDAVGEDICEKYGLTDNIAILKEGIEICEDEITVSLSEEGACVSWPWLHKDTHWQIEEVNVSAKQIISWNDEYLDLCCMHIPDNDAETRFHDYVVKRTMELLTDISRSDAEALVEGEETADYNTDTVDYYRDMTGDLRASIAYADYTEYLRLTDTP